MYAVQVHYHGLTPKRFPKDEEGKSFVQKLFFALYNADVVEVCARVCVCVCLWTQMIRVDAKSVAPPPTGACTHTG